MESSSPKLHNKTTHVGWLRHVHFEHLFAGVSGGVVSNLVLHPLDLVKIRFQGESTVSFFHSLYNLFFVFVKSDLLRDLSLRVSLSVQN